MVVDLPHSMFCAAVALDVGAALRDRQVLAEHHGEGFQNQRIACRPQIGGLAVLERDPGQRRESIVSRQKIALDLILLPRPAAA